MFALIQNAIVWELFDVDPELPSGLDIRQIEAGSKIEAGWIAKEDGSFAPPDPLPVPVPLEVTSAQAKIQLHRANFLDAVKHSVDAIGGEVAIWFSDARIWQRANPHVNEIGAGLELTAAQIDDMFREAAKISV